MKARDVCCLLASMWIAVAAEATSNLNLSKSNVYRLTCSSDLATPAQMKAMLADLDKLGPADEAKLKPWLAANFKRFGIPADRIRKLIILPPSKEMKETGIILLTNAGDEAAARATTVKSSKSNSSE